MSENNKNAKQESRRQFFKSISKFGVVAAVAPAILKSVWPSLAQAEQRRGARPGAGGAAAGGALPLVEPGKGAAAAVNYQHDHAAVKDATLKVARGGLPFEKQLCSNCSFYAKKEVRAGEEVGTCTIFAGQVVKAKGWCSSWNKKA